MFVSDVGQLSIVILSLNMCIFGTRCTYDLGTLTRIEIYCLRSLS